MSPFADAARYFKPCSIDGVGEFMDGCLWRMNPIDIAIKEAGVLWPHVARPDASVSIGTGHLRDDIDTEPSPTDSAVPVDRFFTRLPGSLAENAVLNAHKWHQVTSQWFEWDGEKNDFRLDVELSGSLPALDDVFAMSELRREVRRQHGSCATMTEVTKVLLAKLFFFELTSRPTRSRSGVMCRGQILCDLQPGPILAHFASTLEKENAVFDVLGVSVPLAGCNAADLNTVPLRLPVEVCVSGLDVRFPVMLCKPQQPARQISASPFTLNWLLTAQGWRSPFGRPDHGPVGPWMRSPSKRKQTQPCGERKRARVD